MSTQNEDERPSHDPVRQLITYQRHLFYLLDEFFQRATGKTATAFATPGNCIAELKRNADALTPTVHDAFVWLQDRLPDHYAGPGSDALLHLKTLGGFKLVLGGGSRFLDDQLVATRAAVLYSDTVLVPDPVLPWVESERADEKFRHVHMIQAIHALLHLKPLVDAELPYPPIVVFPSWEKMLEDNDPVTRTGIEQMISDVLSRAAGLDLQGKDAQIEFANRDPERFCRIIDDHRLLVAPGGEPGKPLHDALSEYDEYVEKWRSGEWVSAYKALPAHLRVLQCVAERLMPIHHVLENAEEAGAQPLMCVEQQAHYFQIVAATGAERFERLGLLQPQTRAMIDGMGARRLRWTGDLSTEVLVRLRTDNANVAFRKRLHEAVSTFHDSSITDVERSATEVSHAIASAMADHDASLNRLQGKYDRMHTETLLMGAGAFAGAFIPAIAPLVGAAVPFALAVKYGRDKAAELSEKRVLTGSVIGVLATRRPNSTP